MSTTSWCLSGIHDAAQERYVETKALQFKNDLQQFLCGVIDNKIDFQQQKGEIKAFLTPLYGEKHRLSRNLLRFLNLFISRDEIPVPSKKDLKNIQKGWEKHRIDHNRDPLPVLQEFLDQHAFLPSSDKLWKHVFHAFGRENPDDFFHILHGVEPLLAHQFRFYWEFIDQRGYGYFRWMSENRANHSNILGVLKNLEKFDFLEDEEKIQILKNLPEKVNQGEILERDIHFVDKIVSSGNFERKSTITAFIENIIPLAAAKKEKLYHHLEHLIINLDQQQEFIVWALNEIIHQSRLIYLIAGNSEIEGLNKLLDHLLFISLFYPGIKNCSAFPLYRILFIYLANKDKAYQPFEKIDRVITGRDYDFSMFCKDIIRFLFFRFQPPVVLLNNLNALDDKGFYLLEWIIQGHPVGTFPRLPFGITKKQVHLFFTQCDLLVYNGRAIKRDVLYYAFLMARLMRIYNNEMFLLTLFNQYERYLKRYELNWWDELARFFARYEKDMRNHAIRDYLDYFIHRRGEDPNYRIKGRTLQSVSRQMDEWHEQLRQLRYVDGMFGLSYAEKKQLHKIVWSGDARKNFSLRKAGKTYEIIQIKDAFSLYEEGKDMHHCVGSYAYKCMRGDTTIWSLRLIHQNTHKKLLTIEVSNNRIIQAKGKFNRRATSFEREILLDWAVDQRISMNLICNSYN